MSNNQGYLVFENIECIYTQFEDYFLVIPKNAEDIKKMFMLTHKKNFILKYEHFLYENAFAFIEEIQSNTNYTFKFITKYVVNLNGDYAINEFELIGDEIDAFFSPITYYFYQKKAGENLKIDLLYGKDKIDCFDFLYNNKNVSVMLSYGEMFTRGIASDLILHPKLLISFESTKDSNILYGIYKILVKFLQISRYQRNYNFKPIELYGTVNNVKQHIGFMYEKPYANTNYSKFSDAEYINFKPYINQLLQVIASDENFSVKHLPCSRYDLFEFDMHRYFSVYKAFETEYAKSRKEYFISNEKPIKKIKKEILQYLNEIKKDDMKDQKEIKFINKACDRINQLDTEIGFKNKIISAHDKLSNIIESSEKFMFNKFDLNKSVNSLVDNRGKLAHLNSFDKFTDDEIRDIRFLEVLTYIMFLRRAQIDDNGIEKIVGAVLICNPSMMS